MDDLARAQLIGDLVRKPVIYWHREQDASALSVVTGLPVYLCVVPLVIKSLIIILGDAYSSGVAADATLTIAHVRAGVVIDTVSTSFDPSWATASTTFATPNWQLQPADVVVASISKAGAGVKLPSLALCVALEPE